MALHADQSSRLTPQRSYASNNQAARGVEREHFCACRLLTGAAAVVLPVLARVKLRLAKELVR